ncbi:hypothetical protein FN846DRAFT_911613 [Sphaerosporella brunnea]|uniref:Uncharacterized protein n=1 Tax=Sphaerosporella brunnea TaxID=1250544 RepID=A0A5J5EK39_9PEZI|nr:hypothetical protein FN846DRAFT_911613 [Sphaerosporella brunnea]
MKHPSEHHSDEPGQAFRHHKIMVDAYKRAFGERAGEPHGTPQWYEGLVVIDLVKVACVEVPYGPIDWCKTPEHEPGSSNGLADGDPERERMRGRAGVDVAPAPQPQGGPGSMRRIVEGWFTTKCTTTLVKIAELKGTACGNQHSAGGNGEDTFITTTQEWRPCRRNIRNCRTIVRQKPFHTEMFVQCIWGDMYEDFDEMNEMDGLTFMSLDTLTCSSGNGTTCPTPCAG